jgi:hypothetical protein
MPDGEHSYVVNAWNVVDVIAGLCEQNAASTGNVGQPIWAADARCVTDQVETRGEFV